MPYEEVTEVAYTTSATAKGGRDGRVTSDDGVVDEELARPGNFSQPKANPETLFAAGYAACFNGALIAVGRKAGLDLSASTVTATVTFGKTGDTGFGLAVDLLADVVGVDEPDKAAELVAQAHQACPYSKATRGNIKVTARAA
jgi:osmotically inducible protein OsmC